MPALSMFSLDGKTALVTGAAQGIGKELALGLAQAGADIAAVDINIEGARRTAERIGKLGREAQAVGADVSNSKDVGNMMESVVQQFGRVDVLVNCAGINIQAPAEDYTETDWKRVIGVNLTGTFLINQAVGRQMIKQGGGSIVNIASLVSESIMPSDYQCAYYVSKAGVAKLTRALAVEWARYNIRVNAISPGHTATEQCEGGEHARILLELVPMGRFQETEELVGTVIYLSSDASTFVTGLELFSDGGRTCV
jgi:NAD(P)-dependent dehydrogenase (short-subunit alcohol dehydrogenase family)